MSASGIIKGVLIFAVGAGVGVLGTARHYMKKAEKACNEYEEKCAKEYDDLRDELLAKEEYASDTLKKAGEEATSKTSATVREKRKDYTKCFRTPESVKDIVDRAETKLAEEQGPTESDSLKRKLKGPRLIKAEEYGMDRSLDMLELHYYAENGILTNEDDEVIDEDMIPNLIGDALTKYQFAINDEDEIYVRNEKHGADFMIKKEPYAYYPEE